MTVRVFLLSISGVWIYAEQAQLSSFDLCLNEADAVRIMDLLCAAVVSVVSRDKLKTARRRSGKRTQCIDNAFLLITFVPFLSSS